MAFSARGYLSAIMPRGVEGPMGLWCEMAAGHVRALLDSYHAVALNSARVKQCFDQVQLLRKQSRVNPHERIRAAF